MFNVDTWWWHSIMTLNTNNHEFFFLKKKTWQGGLNYILATIRLESLLGVMIGVMKMQGKVRLLKMWTTKNTYFHVEIMVESIFTPEAISCSFRIASQRKRSDRGSKHMLSCSILQTWLSFANHWVQICSCHSCFKASNRYGPEKDLRGQGQIETFGGMAAILQ